MQVGSLVVSHIASYTATWIALVTLLTVHLGMNYAAVRAVQMTSLNRQRANIVFSTLLDSDLPSAATDTAAPGTAAPETTAATTTTPTPEANYPAHWRICTPAQAAKQERIFERGGILKWTNAVKPSSSSSSSSLLGTCQIGLSLKQFITSHNTNHTVTTANSLKTPFPLPQLTTLFTHEPYLLFLSRNTNGNGNSKQTTWHATILLKPTSTAQDQLKAWTHALLSARLLSLSTFSSPSHPSLLPTTTTNKEPDPETDPETQTQTQTQILKTITHALHILNEGARFAKYLSALKEAGWDLDVAALETRSGRRVSFPLSSSLVSSAST